MGEENIPAWQELFKQYNSIQNDFLNRVILDSMIGIGNILRAKTLIYASAFLQKPRANNTAVVREDLDGFKSIIEKSQSHEKHKNVALLLHTPGGDPDAAESIVDFIRGTFGLNSSDGKLIVIVPTYAMSAGTMIALAAEEIFMDHAGQLGPTDPQLLIDGKWVSAQSIVDQFDKIRDEVYQHGQQALILWAPVLRTFGPGAALVREAEKALEHTKSVVEKWLSIGMFSDDPKTASKIAKYFSDANTHLSHGKRINRDECMKLGLKIAKLEENRELHTHVNKLYAAISIIFQQTPVVKFIADDRGLMWVKNSLEGVPNQT